MANAGWFKGRGQYSRITSLCGAMARRGDSLWCRGYPQTLLVQVVSWQLLLGKNDELSSENLLTCLPQYPAAMSSTGWGSHWLMRPYSPKDPLGAILNVVPFQFFPPPPFHRSQTGSVHTLSVFRGVTALLLLTSFPALTFSLLQPQHLTGFCCLVYNFSPSSDWGTKADGNIAARGFDVATAGLSGSGEDHSKTLSQSSLGPGHQPSLEMEAGGTGSRKGHLPVAPQWVSERRNLSPHCR